MSNETKRGRGRPPADPTTTPAASAVAQMQHVTDRATQILSDGRYSSVASKAARCARAGVPRAVVNAAFEAVEAALADARKAAEQAYTSPVSSVPVPSRVNLADLTE